MAINRNRVLTQTAKIKFPDFSMIMWAKWSVTWGDWD